MFDKLFGKKKCTCRNMMKVSFLAETGRNKNSITLKVLAKNESAPKCEIVDMNTPVLMANDFEIKEGNIKHNPRIFSGSDTKSELAGVAVTNQFSSEIEMTFELEINKNKKVLFFKGNELVTIA